MWRQQVKLQVVFKKKWSHCEERAHIFGFIYQQVKIFRVVFCYHLASSASPARTDYLAYYFSTAFEL